MYPVPAMRPNPAARQVPFTEIVTTSAAMIGARADSNVDRHFPGAIYGVAIYTDTLSGASTRGPSLSIHRLVLLPSGLSIPAPRRAA